MKAFAAAILAGAAVAIKIQEPTYSEVKAHLYEYGLPDELAQEYDMPTYSEVKAELYALSDSELEDLYAMYKAYGPPPPKDELAQEYDMPTYSEAKAHLYEYGLPDELAQEPTYSEVKAELYALSDSELEDLYAMYKAYGPPELELAQEYEMPTYSELKAELYALSDSELEELYAMYKAYGPPPPKGDELAQEGEDGTAPPPKDGPPPAYGGYYLPYDITESELDAMYEMFKAYGMPTDEDLEAMYEFYKAYGMEGIYEAATEE